MARRIWNSARVLAQYDTFIFDCDGVIWNGELAIPGAASTLQRLHKEGKRLLFCSNNSSKSRVTYTKRLRHFIGIDLPPEVMYVSAYGAAQYVKSLPTRLFDTSRQRVFVIGGKGIIDELDAADIKSIHADDVVGDRHYSTAELDALTPDPSIGAVVVGIDFRFSYSKAAYAFRALEQSGRLFIITNQDNTFPSANKLLPGGGCSVAMLRYALGKEPFNIGKPSQWLMELMVNEYGLDRTRTLMVGDKLETDILFGTRAKMDTLLVLSGVTASEDEVRAAEDELKPTYILPSLGSFLETSHL